MRGASRTITIIILLVLMLVLGALAILLYTSITRGGQSNVAVPGQACSQGAAAQCQLNSGGNTGFVCNCSNSGSGFKWDCSQQDTNLCPPPGTQACTPGQTQTGDCGASSCQPGERPLQQCQADGTFGQITCTADPTCTGSSASSTTSSAASSQTSSAISDPDCLIVNPSQANGYIEIGTTCDPAFSYQIEKHVVAVAPDTSSNECLEVTASQPQFRSGAPGDRYDFTGETCGQCVLYRLLGAPAGSQPHSGPFIAAAYTGNCNAATSSSSSTTQVVSSASSSAISAPLPQTGIFDGDANALLAGITLLLMGLVVNRVWNMHYYTTVTAKERQFERQVLQDRD